MFLVKSSKAGVLCGNYFQFACFFIFVFYCTYFVFFFCPNVSSFCRCKTRYIWRNPTKMKRILFSPSSWVNCSYCWHVRSALVLWKRRQVRCQRWNVYRYLLFSASCRGMTPSENRIHYGGMLVWIVNHCIEARFLLEDGFFPETYPDF